MAIDFSYLEGDAPQKESTPTQTATANVTIRVDADSIILCDGDYIDQPIKAGALTKIQLPIGQHLMEFLYTEDPDIKIEQEVDFPEAGKSYLVIIKGLKDLVDTAVEEAKRKAEEEARVKSEAEAEARRMAEEEARKKAEEEAKRKAAEEAGDASYSVILKSAGSMKLAVVSAVMAACDLRLLSAKNLVDAAPCLLKEGLSKTEAEALRAALEEVGAKVEIK